MTDLPSFDLRPESGITRRRFVGLSLGGVLGSALVAGGFPLTAAQGAGPRPKSLILLWLDGGPSQIDTFDPKAGAAGGPFRAIRTSVPGVRVAEHLPRLAERMHRLCLVRTLTSPEWNHHRARALLHTGRAPRVDAAHPGLGAQLALSGGGLERTDSPRAVLLGRFPRTAGAHGFAQGVQNVEASPLTAAERSRYGDSEFGQRCREARQRVEAGSRFVEVILPGWDTHRDNFTRTERLSETLDAGFSALLDDLAERDLLDDTLVLCTGEFGRSPRINGDDGRDHHSASWSAVLAGGGIRGGVVIGHTSDDGGEAVSEPVTVAELHRTIQATLGLSGPGPLLSRGHESAGRSRSGVV